MKSHFLLLLLFLLPVVADAQPNQEPEKLFSDAIFFYNIEDYKEAAFLFQQLLKDNPENAHFNYYAGMSLLNVTGQEKNAIPFLERAVMFTGIKIKQKRFKEKRAPHHAWFYLGNAYRINNQLDKALESYQKFQNIKNFEKYFNLRILEEEINSCSRAKIIQDSPLNLKKVNLGKPINTETSNYNPVLSSNGEIIVYVTSQRFYEAVMYSEKTGHTWGAPVNITSQLGSDGDMFPSFLTADGKSLYLVKKTRSGSDIYLSTYNGSLWSNAKPLNGNINSRADEAHASLSPDERTLYFSSTRKGGFGGLDLYVSEKQNDGEWGPARNMGSVINTPADENTPFLSPDGNTLFFSSTGHFNMGGYDIFFTRKNLDGAWATPINIGYPINTTNDDLFFFPSGNGQSGYIAIYDDEDGIGQEDIYYVEIIPFTDTLEKLKLFERSFRIYLTDEETGEKTEIQYDSKTDQFKVQPSGEGKRYSVEVEENK